jgi:hypothetical protein
VDNWKVGFASISLDAFFKSSLKSGVLTVVLHTAVHSIEERSMRKEEYSGDRSVFEKRLEGAYTE